MTKREWQIEMANRFAKRGMAKEGLDTRSYLIGRYDSTKTLTDEEISLPQREWVGLTDDEIQSMIKKAMAYYGYKPEHSRLTSGAGFYVLVQNIEARLKDKNT